MHITKVCDTHLKCKNTLIKLTCYGIFMRISYLILMLFPDCDDKIIFLFYYRQINLTFF